MKKQGLPVKVLAAILAAGMVIGDVPPAYAAQESDDAAVEIVMDTESEEIETETANVEVTERTETESSSESETEFKTKAAKDVSGLAIKYESGKMMINWDAAEGVASYDVYRAKSRYSKYTKIAEVSAASYTDLKPDDDKYENYYKVVPKGEKTDGAAAVSLETEMFGENMYVFSPEDDMKQVYDTINNVYLIQGGVDGGVASNREQFGSGRYAFAFKTGDYSNMEKGYFDMSYYMQFLGLGKTPYDVTIKNVHVPATLPDNNVTCNFWMDIENLSISAMTAEEEAAAKDDAQEYDFKWAVSQAAPARRLYVQRPTRLNSYWDGWASGGYISDSLFTSEVGSWSQQQYYIRNSKMEDFYGVNWNFVAQGCTIGQGQNMTNTINGVTAAGNTKAQPAHPFYDLKGTQGQSNWANGGYYTFLDKTDVIKEKPFLYFDEDVKEYKVFVPGLRKNTTGVSFTRTDMGEGKSLDINEFYIAKADTDNAASINKALEEGKNIILTPGIYYAEEPIEIKNADTVFLGLGLATIIPTNTDTAVRVADVDGVSLAGIILDADSYARNMLVVGDRDSDERHTDNPIVLQDIFVRIGGVHGGVASTDQALVINANDTIGDDFWIWRADHGEGTGWNLNGAKNGVVVNGDYVTLYGNMTEHFQEYDVLWRGEYGKTYFLQNEKCYDPQNQEDWMSHNGTQNGFAAYKVADNVKHHYAVGLGSYDVFIYTNGASIHLDNSYEVPNTEDVVVENACIVEIADGKGPAVGINHIINGAGPAISTGKSGKGYSIQAVTYYNNGTANFLKDFYNREGDKSNLKAEDVNVEDNIPDPTPDPKVDNDPVKIPVTDVKINEAEDHLSMKVDETVTLTTTITPSDATDKNVKWTSSDDSVVSVNRTGTLTAKKAGNVTITATCDGRSTSISVAVIAIGVTDITIVNSKAIEQQLAVGDRIQIETYVAPEEATDKSVVYSSSNNAVATVSETGLIEAKSEGTAIITVSSLTNPEVKQTISVNVKAAASIVESIKIVNGDIVLLPDMQKQLTVKITPDSAANETITWDSDNSIVASVSKDGKVTAGKTGTAEITATAAGRKDKIKVTVVEESKEIVIGNTVREVKVGEKLDLLASSVPAGAFALAFNSDNTAIATVDAAGVVTGVQEGIVLINIGAANDPYKLRQVLITVKKADAVTPVVKPTVKWNVSYKTCPLQLQQSTTALKPTGLVKGDKVKSYKSSNKKIVTVNSKGKITAKKVGKAKITVTTKYGAKATITIKVQKTKVKLTGISVNKTKVTLKKGKKFQIEAVKKYITAKDKVTYKSSNSKVATVNSKGKITAKKKGKATITVKCGKKVKKVKVTVK